MYVCVKLWMLGMWSVLVQRLTNRWQHKPTYFSENCTDMMTMFLFAQLVYNNGSDIYELVHNAYS